MTTVPSPLHGCSAFRWIDPEAFSLHHPRASTDRKSQFGCRISTCAHGERETSATGCGSASRPESSLANRISPPEKIEPRKKYAPRKISALRKFSACPKSTRTRAATPSDNFARALARFALRPAGHRTGRDLGAAGALAVPADGRPIHARYRGGGPGWRRDQ